MITMPSALFAFANDWSDQHRHLRSLLGEGKAIGKALAPLASAGLQVLPPVYNATVHDVLEAFREHRDQIRVFHFAGHASGSSLLFEDDAGIPTEIHAGGLAGYLGQQSGLVLVFLNGCATAPQVRQLRDAGVKAVVAATQDIDDTLAAEFAEAFYAELATRPLRAAYEAAVHAAQTRWGTNPGTIKRDVVGHRTSSTPTWPWTLDCDPAYERWTLRSELDRLARQRLRIRLGMGGAAVLTMLCAVMLLSAGARHTACRAPGLRLVCMTIGIGPSADEQALWEHATAQGTGQGLRVYLQTYPAGMYAEEARARLDGCSHEPVETLGPQREQRYPLTVAANHSRLQATEADARDDAVQRGRKDADTTCKLLASSMKIGSAVAEPREWRCVEDGHRFTCSFDGEIICRGQDLIASNEEHCNETLQDVGRLR